MKALEPTGNMKIRNNLIRISKGPQFNIKGAPFIAMAALACFILCVSFFINLEIAAGAVSFMVGLFSLNRALDIRGIELNRERMEIREYKALFWWRMGKFTSISDYNSIGLLQENVVVRTTRFSDHTTDTFHYYRIYLVDEINNKAIFLAEMSNFHNADISARRIAELTGMTYVNLLKKGIRKVSIV